MTPRTPGLLVSVRSAAEARAALAGGADLIDVKEPTRGPLGKADDEVIAQVVAEVAGRVPVSAAMGELADAGVTAGPPGVTFRKWGLAGLAAARWLPDPHPHTVLVAYADHRRASSPDPEWLAAMARERGYQALLIDTAVKDGSTLLDWIAPPVLARICTDLAKAGVQVALAGSLTAGTTRRLAPLAPTWFAVRGAACVGGREGTVCADRVRALKAVIDAAAAG